MSAQRWVHDGGDGSTFATVHAVFALCVFFLILGWLFLSAGLSFFVSEDLAHKVGVHGGIVILIVVALWILGLSVAACVKGCDWFLQSLRDSLAGDGGIAPLGLYHDEPAFSLETFHLEEEEEEGGDPEELHESDTEEQPRSSE